MREPNETELEEIKTATHDLIAAINLVRKGRGLSEFQKLHQHPAVKELYDSVRQHMTKMDALEVSRPPEFNALYSLYNALTQAASAYGGRDPRKYYADALTDNVIKNPYMKFVAMYHADAWSALSHQGRVEICTDIMKQTSLEQQIELKTFLKGMGDEGKKVLREVEHSLKAAHAQHAHKENAPSLIDHAQRPTVLNNFLTQLSDVVRCRHGESDPIRRIREVLERNDMHHTDQFKEIQKIAKSASGSLTAKIFGNNGENAVYDAIKKFDYSDNNKVRDALLTLQGAKHEFEKTSTFAGPSRPEY